MSRIKIVILTSCALLLSVMAGAQTDTIRAGIIPTNDTLHVQNDTVKKEVRVIGPADTSSGAIVKKKHVFEPIPKKAGLFSAIIPGSGQIYNRQYWKAPLVYGAAAAGIYFFSFNYDKYTTYKKAYFGRLTNGGNTLESESEELKRYTTNDLKTLQDEYRKYLDMTVMFSALGYAVQIIDAIASAHLRNFDMSRDISFQFKPTAQPTYAGNGIGLGVGIAMKFK